MFNKICGIIVTNLRINAINRELSIMTGKYRFWIGIALIWIAHFFIDFMIGVWPIYKTMIGFDLVLAGLIAGISMFIGEGLQLYFGALSDRGFHQRLLTLGVGLTLVVPFISYTTHPLILFFLVLCSFIGSGAFHPAAAGMIVGLSKGYRSLFIALFSCGGTAGAAVGQYLFTKAHKHFDGNTTIFLIPILLVTICCGLFRFPKLENEETAKTTDFKKSLGMLKEKKFELSILYAIQLALQIINLSFVFLLPDILKERGHPEWFYLGGAHFFYIGGAALISLPVGYCIDRLGYQPILIGIILASFCLFYLFLTSALLSLGMTIALLVLIGGTMGIIVPVAVAGGNSLVPSSASGLVSAIYMGGCSCLAGFGPMLASLIATQFDGEAAVRSLQVLSVLFIVALFLFYLLPRKAAASQDLAFERI